MARLTSLIGNRLRRPRRSTTQPDVKAGVSASETPAGSHEAVVSTTDSRATDPDAPRRVVLHLGSQKTGTTAVQAWCRRHTPDLQQHGVTVRTTQPDIRQALGGHYEVRGEGAGARFSAFLDEAWTKSGHSSLFYSSESNVGPAFPRGEGGLYPHLRDNIEVIARATAGVERHVQFTVRDYGPFIESAYLQQLKHGKPIAFADFVADIDPDVSWRPIVQHLMEVFGAEHVTVYDYDAPAPLVERLLSDALHRLGAGTVLDGTDWDHRTNERYTQRMADLSLAVLPHLRGEEELKAFRNFLRKTLNDPDDRPAEFFTRDRQEELAARYASDKEWMREQWGLS